MTQNSNTIQLKGVLSTTLPSTTYAANEAAITFINSSGSVVNFQAGFQDRDTGNKFVFTKGTEYTFDITKVDVTTDYQAATLPLASNQNNYLLAPISGRMAADFVPTSLLVKFLDSERAANPLNAVSTSSMNPCIDMFHTLSGFESESLALYHTKDYAICILPTAVA